MYDTIAIEDLGRPAVALCNKDFLLDARSAALGRGMPGVRVVPEAVPCECTAMEQIEAGINAAMDDIIAALTQPLTDEEKSPKPKEAEQTPRIAFKGDLKEVNLFFYKSGWGDGLPIVPPTEKAVEEMLTGTDLPGDHVVDRIMPRLGKATVEKIAINAVMAGALPTYMPLLIAGVQALMDPKSYFGTWGVSTSSFAPFWVINGPVRNDLNIVSGSGALSPGNIANAAIGRAMGLIIKNIGGIRKGIEDMGVIGNPSKYSMVLAENEEENPWEPLHVEQGFNKEESTVSLCFNNSFSLIWPYGIDDKGVLTGVIYNVLPGRRGLFCLILPPAHARTLATNGWTKKQIKVFISEYARVPAYRHGGGIHPGSYLGVLPKERLPMNPEDPVAVFWGPDWIKVIVAGGPGNFMGLVQGGMAEGMDWVTRKLELPANWDKLVKKYKGIVPTYVRY